MNSKSVAQQKFETKQCEDQEHRYYVELAKEHANVNTSSITTDESFLEMIGEMIHEAQQER